MIAIITIFLIKILKKQEKREKKLNLCDMLLSKVCHYFFHIYLIYFCDL